jgi:hypothetical protein
MMHRLKILALLAGLHATCLRGAQNGPAQAQPAREKARQAAQEGKIAYKLTTPEELKELLGPPADEKRERDGGMELPTLQYPDLTARFGRVRETAPFTLLTLTDKGFWLGSLLGQEKGAGIDFGQNRQVVLRAEADLAKFDPFWGFAGLYLFSGRGDEVRAARTGSTHFPFGIS